MLEAPEPSDRLLSESAVMCPDENIHDLVVEGQDSRNLMVRNDDAVERATPIKTDASEQ